MSLMFELMIAAIFAIITGVIFEAIKTKYHIEFEVSIKKNLKIFQSVTFKYCR